MNYDGRKWQGGTTQDVGTYMFAQHGAEVKDLTTDTGATFVYIALPMLADIERERAVTGNAKMLEAGALA